VFANKKLAVTDGKPAFLLVLISKMFYGGSKKLNKKPIARIKILCFSSWDGFIQSYSSGQLIQNRISNCLVVTRAIVTTAATTSFNIGFNFHDFLQL
jgi:hypothetical protein